MAISRRRLSGTTVAVATAVFVSFVFSASLLVRTPPSPPANEPPGILQAPIAGLPTNPILEIRMLPGGDLSDEQRAWEAERTGVPGFVASSLRVAAVYQEGSVRFDVVVWEQLLAVSTSPDGTPIIEYPDGSNPTADLVGLVCTSAPISSRPPVGVSCEFEAPGGGPRRTDPHEGMTILLDLGDAVAVVFENGFGETAVVYPADGVAMLNWPYRTFRVIVHEADGTTSVVDR